MLQFLGLQGLKVVQDFLHQQYPWPAGGQGEDHSMDILCEDTGWLQLECHLRGREYFVVERNMKKVLSKSFEGHYKGVT